MNLYSFNASGPDRSNEPAFVEQLRLQVELSSNLSAFYENHELYMWRGLVELQRWDGSFYSVWQLEQALESIVADAEAWAREAEVAGEEDLTGGGNKNKSDIFWCRPRIRRDVLFRASGFWGGGG